MWRLRGYTRPALEIPGAPMLATVVAVLALLSPPAQTPPGSVSGRVVDDTTQAPVADAIVRLMQPFNPRTDTTPPWSAETRTDGDGHFQIAGISPGRYLA